MIERLQPATPGFLERLRNAGVEPGDGEELRLNKQLLFFATGLVSAASMLWLAIYWAIGPQFSATLPYVFQFVLAGNLLAYVQWRDFDFAAPQRINPKGKGEVSVHRLRGRKSGG